MRGSRGVVRPVCQAGMAGRGARLEVRGMRGHPVAPLGWQESPVRGQVREIAGEMTVELAGEA